MYSILVCDDEKDIAAAIKIYLETEGYKVFTAENGREALDIAAKEEIHLIIMDVMMPVMDGIEAVRKLREDSIIPVIMLTAKSEDVDKVLGLGIGADDYVTKPFNPIELIARAKSQIRRYVRFGGQPEKSDDKVLAINGLVLQRKYRWMGKWQTLHLRNLKSLRCLCLKKAGYFRLKPYTARCGVKNPMEVKVRLLSI